MIRIKKKVTTLLPWLMAFAGFALYLLYDIDSFAALWKPLRLGFTVGTLLIAAATGM